MLSAKPMEPVAVAFPTALPVALASDAHLTASGRIIAAVPVSVAASPSLPPSSRRPSADSIPTLSREVSAQEREQPPARLLAPGLAPRTSSASLLTVPEDAAATHVVLDASQQEQVSSDNWLAP